MEGVKSESTIQEIRHPVIGCNSHWDKGEPNLCPTVESGVLESVLSVSMTLLHVSAGAYNLRNNYSVKSSQDIVKCVLST